MSLPIAAHLEPYSRPVALSQEAEEAEEEERRAEEPADGDDDIEAGEVFQRHSRLQPRPARLQRTHARLQRRSVQHLLRQWVQPAVLNGDSRNEPASRSTVHTSQY